MERKFYILEKKEEAISIQGSMIGRKEKNGPQGTGVNEDVCFTLTSADQHGVVHPIQNATRGKDQNGLGVGSEEDPMYTLDMASQHAIAWSERGRDGTTTPEVEKSDVMPALRTAPQSQVGVCSLISDTTPKGSEEVSMALRATNKMLTSTPEYTIRRLTPKECERLQGFEDEHTLYRMKLELSDNEWIIVDSDGKPVVEKQADGHRYRQLGNAVSVNVARWIGEGIKEELSNAKK